MPYIPLLPELDRDMTRDDGFGLSISLFALLEARLPPELVALGMGYAVNAVLELVLTEGDEPEGPIEDVETAAIAFAEPDAETGVFGSEEESIEPATAALPSSGASSDMSRIS